MEFIVSVIAILIMVVPFWKITAKAGFPGALSLLLIVPIVNVVFVYYLAFARWPSLKE